jgi:Nif-specific regulatory protein
MATPTASQPATGDASARLRLLYELGCKFAAHIELDELIPFVVSECRTVQDAEGASVLLLDTERDELYFPYVAEDDPEVVERLLQLRFPADRGIAGAVLRSGRALRVDDVAHDPRFYTGIDRSTGITTRNLLAAPLNSRQGPIGVIQVVNRRNGEAFTDDDLALLEALAGSVAVAIENARLYAQLKASEQRLRARVGALQRDLARNERFHEIVGTSPAMAEVFRLMDSAASSPVTVLIEGATGTGKELVARGIHRGSARADGPFIAINCAALPENLLESELFGHRRGAFTGALQDRVGLFEAASGGTVLLDEVGEMPLAMQAKLLRVLQEGEVTPIGDHRTRKVDVRVISATNRSLEAEVADGSFREDLYYRLTTFPIRLPSLRERREDIPLLVGHFLSATAERHRKQIAGIEDEALEALECFDWPGNVRQLQNEIDRAVALARDGETIGLAHLSARLTGATGKPAAEERASGSAAEARGDEAPPAGADAAGGPLREARAAFEARYIADVLRQQKGNVSRSAQVLGLSRAMLQKKIKDYGLR